MSFTNSGNPTVLRIGHSGQLEGRSWTVLGRVALRSDDGYAWQEFYLGNEQGETATLVYEDDVWKLFKVLEPADPLTAAEAATRRVGDTVVTNGINAQIDYVGASRVTHIEGEAPEGVEVGDRARYFNATQGNGMLVVSWTGDEVEYFHGRDLPFNAVETAFGLPQRSQWSRLGLNGFNWSSFDANYLVGGLVAIVMVLVIAAMLFDEIAVPMPPEPPAKVAAAPVRLPDQAKGVLQGHAYTVRGHAVVEISRPGRKFERHEYLLTDETGATALLVQGLSGLSHEWHLLKPGSFPKSFTPYDAAQVKAGQATTPDGKRSSVAYLFQSKACATDGTVNLHPWPNEVQYGFVLNTPEHWVLARWTEREMQVYSGLWLSVKEVAAAFGMKAEELGRQSL
jgi:hypothetical protein